MYYLFIYDFFSVPWINLHIFFKASKLFKSTNPNTVLVAKWLRNRLISDNFRESVDVDYKISSTLYINQQLLRMCCDYFMTDQQSHIIYNRKK